MYTKYKVLISKKNETETSRQYFLTIIKNMSIIVRIMLSCGIVFYKWWQILFKKSTVHFNPPCIIMLLMLARLPQQEMEGAM